MALVRNAEPCWEVTCDKCGDGDNYDYGGSFHYDTEQAARESMENMDWKVMPDGRALHLECFEELREQVPCPDGAHCRGGGCGACPSDEQVFALLEKPA